MAHRRAEMDALGVTARQPIWPVFPTAAWCASPASVIVRQRPGTANGFVFLSMEDETGIMNAIVTPPTFDRIQIGGAGRTLFTDRWRVAEFGRSDFSEGGKGAGAAIGGSAGVA